MRDVFKVRKASQHIAQPWIESIPQRVADQVRAQHGEENGEPGKQRDSPFAYSQARDIYPVVALAPSSLVNRPEVGGRSRACEGCRRGPGPAPPEGCALCQPPDRARALRPRLAH